MRAIILAAGVGSRLTKEGLPKALTPLENGQTPLQRQLRAFQATLAPKMITLVVGYKKELFAPYSDNHNVLFAPHYASTNTAKSLELALEDVDEDVIWINGDVVFHPKVFTQVTQVNGNVMVVTPNDLLNDEEVKYRADGEGRLLTVSKEEKEGMGEAVGINRFCKKDLPLLKKYLKECGSNDYFEKAIEKCLNAGILVKALPIPFEEATEIDFPEDLAFANLLIKKWEANP